MSYTQLNYDTPKARKAHKCDWCGQAIAVGERYVSVAAIFDGEFQVTRLHSECNAAFEEVLKEFPPGALVGFDMTQPRGGSGDGIYEV